jgi:hypothetical protein
MKQQISAGFVLVLLAAIAVHAADPTPPAPATRRAPAPLTQPSDTNDDDEQGYQPIFDGKTLDGWQGDPKYWRVENGCLVGEVTPETILKRNTFIIWRGGKTKDFELKVQYRISDRGNSGINYRSEEIPDLPLALRGYQADIDGANRYTGQNYEERGRTFLALRGQVTQIEEGKPPAKIASLGDREAMKAFVKSGEEWNEYHLIVRGNVAIHILNGHMMSMVIDDDAKNRKSEGLLGVQVHVGPPMKVEFRNFRLRQR